MRVSVFLEVLRGLFNAAIPSSPTTGSVGQVVKDNLDTNVGSRLATAGYTAPDNANIGVIVGRVDITLSSRLDTSVSSRLAGASYKDPDTTALSITPTTGSLTDLERALEKRSADTSVTGSIAQLIAAIPTSSSGAVDLNAIPSLSAMPPYAFGTTSSVTFAAANAVVFIPFRVTSTFTAKRVAVMNAGTASGNTTVGIYDSSRNLLRATAATAMSGTFSIQFINLTSNLTMAAGLYFMALSNSGTTGTYLAHTSSGSLNIDINLLGCRGANTGGIVTTPTINDITTSTISTVISVFDLAILGSTSTSLD